jgi:hypothetical protein
LPEDLDLLVKTESGPLDGLLNGSQDTIVWITLDELLAQILKRILAAGTLVEGLEETRLT